MKMLCECCLLSIPREKVTVIPRIDHTHVSGKFKLNKLPFQTENTKATIMWVSACHRCLDTIENGNRTLFIFGHHLDAC